MARIKKEVKDKIIEAINNLDNNIKDKCSLCNITLTDVVLKISTTTDAPVETVAGVIADEINEGRPKYEHVSKKALICRIKRTTGEVKHSKRVLKNELNHSNRTFKKSEIPENQIDKNLDSPDADKVALKEPVVKEIPGYTVSYSLIDVKELILPAEKNDYIKELEDKIEVYEQRFKNIALNSLSGKKESTSFNPPPFTVPNFDTPDLGVVSKDQDIIKDLKEQNNFLKSNLLKAFEEGQESIESKMKDYDEVVALNDEFMAKSNLKPRQINNKEFVEMYKAEKRARTIAQRLAAGYDIDGLPIE
jgi:hypothetical protein